MAVSVKFEPIDRNTILWLKEDLTPEAQSKALANFAMDALHEAQDTNKRALGRVPSHETWVDGRQGAQLGSVKPEGRIIFEFDFLVQSFAWIGEMLEKNSPKKSGRFSKSHIFLADNVEADPKNPPPAEEYVYVNTQPYARKIERGMSAKAPAGVYQGVATMSNRRFGNVARVSFGYRSLLGSSALASWANKTNLGRRGAASKRADWLRRQPAIIIKVS